MTLIYKFDKIFTNNKNGINVLIKPYSVVL